MNLVSDDVYSVRKAEILYRFNTESRHHRECRPMNGIILYVKGGHIRKMASGEEFRSSENELFYLPYGSSYTSYLLEKGTEYYEINFLVEVNGESRSLFDDFLVLHSPESDRFQPVFKEIFSLAIASKPGSRAAIAGLVFNLVSMLEEGHGKDTDLSSSLSRIQFTVNYRCGSHVSAFEADKVDPLHNATRNSTNHMAKFGTEIPIPTREDLWKRWTYFIKAVLPEAEKAGVRLVTHPSDPPVEQVAGVPRIFISKEDYLYADSISNSDAWGLNMCLGCFSQLGGEEYVLDMIHTFVPRGKVSMVHLRDVQGTINNFNECFLGDERCNPAKVLMELKRCGYDGLIMDDHVPFLTGATRWGHTARAYEIGYIQGMRMMLDYIDSLQVK